MKNQEFAQFKKNANFAVAMAGMVWLAMVAGPAMSETPAQEAVTLDIPAQPLGDALSAFAQQSGLQILFHTETGNKVTVASLTGTFTPVAALQRLLANTSLEYEFVDERTVAIRKVGESKPTVDAGAVGGMKLAQAEGSGADSAAAVEGEGDEGGVKLEEVVVTAQKRKQTVIDVPMSITAISGDQLAAKGIKNILDLSYAVPGMSTLEIGPGQQFVVIRGISGVRGTSPLVGMYLDEIPVSTFQGGFTQSLDLRILDLERVEILKGPQGTLFGEGAAGGVIRYITKDPDLLRVGGEIGTEFYNTADSGDWSEEVTGVFNLPLVKDVFGIRVAATYQNIAGWIDRPAGIPAPTGIDFLTGQPITIGEASVGHEDFNDSEVKHVRVKALFAPTENLRVKGTAEIHRNDGGGTNVVNTGRRKGSNFMQAYDRNESTRYFDDYDLFNLSATYNFNFAQLLVSSSRAKTEGNQRVTQLLDDEPQPWLEILLPANSVGTAVTYAQELRLTSVSQGRLNWTIGANYKDAKNTITETSTGIRALIDGGGLALYGLGVGTRPVSKSENWAGFIDASYKVTDRLELGGGLRYFEDDRQSHDLSLPAAGKLQATFQKATYRAYARYELAPSVNIYGSVGTGFRSGDFNGTDNIRLGAPVGYDPEEVISYELGTKMSLLAGRVQVEGAVFYSEYRDMLADQLITSPVDGTPLQVTGNAGEAEVRGFEASVSWLTTDRLVLTLAGGVIDTEITKEAEVSPVYFKGDPVDFSPKYRVATTAEYRFQWGAAPGFLRLDYNRQGKSFQSDRSNGLLPVPAEQRQIAAPEVAFLNASLGGTWNGWAVTLFGRNLMDEAEELNGCITGCAAQARPRTVGISIGKEF